VGSRVLWPSGGEGAATYRGPGDESNRGARRLLAPRMVTIPRDVAFWMVADGPAGGGVVGSAKRRAAGWMDARAPPVSCGDGAVTLSRFVSSRKMTEKNGVLLWSGPSRYGGPGRRHEGRLRGRRCPVAVDGALATQRFQPRQLSALCTTRMRILTCVNIDRRRRSFDRRTQGGPCNIDIQIQLIDPLLPAQTKGDGDVHGACGLNRVLCTRPPPRATLKHEFRSRGIRTCGS
jgi:hypothetical protein